MKMKTILTRAALVAIAALMFSPAGRAQTAPPAPSPTPTEEIIELSPFTVTADKGWSANDTLSANRTKQNLKDVPVNIDAITADFMDDLSLRMADDVAGFVANVYAAPIMENDNEKGNFAFRGLSQTNNVSRNYFRWYIPSDTYNIERLDFGKGSNSLIFGEVEPGGNGAAFTKRPLMKTFGSATAIRKSEGAYRYQFDYNWKLREGLAFRFNAVRRQDKTFQDASAYKFEGKTIAALWQPFKKTSIRLEFEQGDYDSGRGLAGINLLEQSAKGLGFDNTATFYTSDGVWIDVAALASINRGSSNGATGGDPTLVEGRFLDVTMRNAAGAIVGTKRFNGYPKSYNIRGSFDNHSRPFHTFSATVEQTLGPVNFEFAYNYQYQSEERNDNFFGGTTADIGVDVNGRPYIDSSLDRKYFANAVHALRSTAVYKFDKFKWMEQLFVGSWEYREDQTLNFRTQWFNIAKLEAGTATTINTTSDRGRLRIYLDDPAFYSRALFDRMSPAVLPTTPTVHMVPLHYFASGSSAADGTAWRQAYAASLSASGRYFGGRLQSLVGARRDYGRTYDYQAIRKEGKYNEDINPPSKSDALPGEYLEDQNLHLSNTSYTGGLTYALTKDVNLYSVYSESFRFQAVRTFDRVPIGPIAGVTKEIGLKGSLFNNRATVTLGVFQIDRQNVVLTWNKVISFTDTNTEDLMNPNNVLPGDPGYKFREPGTASASRNYTAVERSKGFDVTMMLRPVKGLQVRLTLGRADVASTPNLASFRAYYDAAVKRPDESATMLATAKLLLDTLDVPANALGARAALWSASWVADYSFARESWKPLQGLRVGVNGVWRDDYLIAVRNGQKLRGGSTHLVNAYVMRDQKIWGQQVRLRAGVKNITDLENGDIRKTGFTTMSNGSIVYKYSYVMPPQYEMEATIKF